MTLYLPIGPPASGKSTLARWMVEEGHLHEDAIVSTDRLREILTGNRSDQSANNVVFRMAEQIAINRLLRDLDVFYDATNLNPAWYQLVLNTAVRLGAQIKMVMMVANDPECRKRNAKRPNPVPEQVMESFFRMRHNFHHPNFPGDQLNHKQLIASLTNNQGETPS